MNIAILRFDSLDSTNTEAARQARSGVDEGLCVIARHQSAGRGRQGRMWISALDEGLYFSIVLRPRMDPKFLSLITLMAGVSICDTFVELGLKPDIKWVNDLLVGDKKIAGILAETVDTPSGLAVVVGIGINLTSGSFPDEIAETVTSIEAEIGRLLTPEELAATVIRYLTSFYEVLNGKNGPVEILDHWRNRSSYYQGQNVRVTLHDGSFYGKTDGLEENGALRVKMADGSLTIVQAGDVQRLRKT